MSIQTRGRERMPQPEQWLSEHEPWSTIAICAIPFAAAFLAWLFS